MMMVGTKDRHGGWGPNIRARRGPPSWTVSVTSRGSADCAPTVSSGLNFQSISRSGVPSRGLKPARCYALDTMLLHTLTTARAEARGSEECERARRLKRARSRAGRPVFGPARVRRAPVAATPRRSGALEEALGVRQSHDASRTALRLFAAHYQTKRTPRRLLTGKKGIFRRIWAPIATTLVIRRGPWTNAGWPVSTRSAIGEYTGKQVGPWRPAGPTD